MRRTGPEALRTATSSPWTSSHSGPNSALATVQWAYKGACEEMLWKTTFSYNLYRRDGVWKILVQTMHDS